jgi:hypothetical protein
MIKFNRNSTIIVLVWAFVLLATLRLIIGLSPICLIYNSYSSISEIYKSYLSSVRGVIGKEKEWVFYASLAQYFLAIFFGLMVLLRKKSGVFFIKCLICSHFIIIAISYITTRWILFGSFSILGLLVFWVLSLRSPTGRTTISKRE